MRKLSLVLIMSAALTGCFDSDDDNDDNGMDDPQENTAPSAISEAFATPVDTEFSDTLSADDPDGDTLTFTLGDEPTLGSVEVMESGEFTYTPNSEQTGSDSFTFTVSDGQGGEDTGTIEITIETEQVLISSYVRSAFAQEPTDTPLPVNGREFEQDVEDPEAFNDLLDN